MATPRRIDGLGRWGTYPSRARELYDPPLPPARWLHIGICLHLGRFRGNVAHFRYALPSRCSPPTVHRVLIRSTRSSSERGQDPPTSCAGEQRFTRPFRRPARRTRSMASPRHILSGYPCPDLGNVADSELCVHGQSPMIEDILKLSDHIRYVAIYRDGQLEKDSKSGTVGTSSSESDKYGYIRISQPMNCGDSAVA